MTMELLHKAIADLEAQLGLQPDQDVTKFLSVTKKPQSATDPNAKKQKQKKPQQQQSSKPPPANLEQEEICKLEFKVGVITKVWVHEKADTLYCEEIDVGEESGPRQIASGLRNHFTEAQMLGQRLLVISNLKAKNLVGFKSHGMVLCCSDANGKVEFVEPPANTPIGTFHSEKEHEIAFMTVLCKFFVA